MRTLQRKVAVITGAGSGIGRALAFQLAQRGTAIAVVDVNKDSAADVAEQVVAGGGHATAHTADVSSETDVWTMRDEVLAAHGVVDIVINNAGIVNAPAPFEDTSMSDIRRIIDINLIGVIHGSLAFIPHLLARPEANLVNVASYAGLLGTSQMSAYSTSKFGVRGFTDALRMEYTGSSVAVTLVLPGVTKTSIMKNSPLVEDARKPAIQDTFDKGPGLSAEVVANAVIKGILKNKPRVLPGTDTKAVDLLTRIAPGGYTRLLAGFMRRTMANNFG